VDLRDALSEPLDINTIAYERHTVLEASMPHSSIRVAASFAKHLSATLTVVCIGKDTTVLPSSIYEDMCRFISEVHRIDYEHTCAVHKYLQATTQDYMYLVRELKPFPRAVTYEDIGRLVLGDYYYTNKSTGVRVNVYVTPNGTYTRDLNWYTRLVCNYASREVTILDAEDVGGKIYMFDVLVYEGVPVVDAPFVKRLKVMEMLDIPGILHKKFHKLVSVDSLRKLCSRNEGCVIYNGNSIYEVPPMKIKYINTVDVVVDKQVHKIYWAHENSLREVKLALFA
jgi:hypothetical protein